MGGLSFFQKLIFFLNILFSISLFIACIVPHTTSASLAFFSLVVPILVVVNFLFLFYWIFRMRRQFILSLVTLLFGYFSMGNFIGFSGSPKMVEKDDSFSILSFNSLGFRGKQDEWKSTAGDTIVKFVAQENPDILCFQEFDYKKSRPNFFKEYPYKYVDYEFGEDRGRMIQAIYSKYKIINKGFLKFPESHNSAVYADIIFKMDTIRLYNLHLESLNIRPSSIKNEDSGKLFSRLRTSFAKQMEQSDIVHNHMENSPYPNIVCGDFNSTQFSRVYLNIKAELKDTFLEKGTGLGSTIQFWKFPFRIDYILVAPGMEVLSHTNYTIELSDHEPIMASIKLGAD